jgi:hypothetical protein
MNNKKKIIIASLSLVLLILVSLLIVIIPKDADKTAKNQLASSRDSKEPAKNKESKEDTFSHYQITSFLLQWQHPETGLIPTEIAKNNILNPRRDFASTYVLAVSQQILWMEGLNKEAAKLSETVKNLLLKGELSNTLDIHTGLNKDFYISSGPNAYWGMSFIREYQSSRNESWLVASESMANFLLSLQSDNGAIVKDPNPQSAEHRVKSTEENLACYAFFNMLYEITENKRYYTAKENILKWLAKSGVYDKKKNYFTVGTFQDEVDKTYSLDVNALAIIILGPQILNNKKEPYVFGGIKTADRLADSFKKARVEVDYRHPSGRTINDVKGYDFTDKEGRPGREPTVSCEFSAQAALAYMVLAEYEIKKNNKKNAFRYIDSAENIINELSRIAYYENHAASLPYATASSIRRFKFDNWYITRAEANISSSWIAFALKGFNPYKINGFELASTLKPYASWLSTPGEIVSKPKKITLDKDKAIVSGVDLNVEEDAVREKDYEQPTVYYKSIYNKSEESVELARKVLEANMMTSFSCWVGSLIDKSKQNYDAIGITSDGTIIKSKYSSLPQSVAQAIKEQYLYYDKKTQTQWRIAPRYNLNIDFSKGSYYAFEIDENYNIVEQFKTELDVPLPNRADLKSLESQYKSTAGLKEGHKIIRYFYALEVDRDYNIVKTYNSIDELPGLASKIPIDKETYEKLINADEEQRQIFRRAGYLPDGEGNLATCEYGNYYYARILALDTSRYLTIKTYSRLSGNEIVGGTRSLLADWEVDEKAKLNALKYEEGLVKGMVMKTPLADETFSETEPVWIYVGQKAVKKEKKKFEARLRKLLWQINEEKDAVERQKLIVEFDRMRWEASWRDDDGILHVIFYGLKEAQRNFAELQKAKERAELSYREYVSILGYNEEGNDLRDTYGRVWLKVINKNTGTILHVEVYDIAGNLQFLLAGDIEIDPLYKTVAAESRTDVLYDKTTGQMLGSHSYYIDESGQWVADISEGIFRGYTPNKEHFIIERRIFKKDNYGNILYKENEPLYSEKIEYYAPEGDLSAQISGNTLTVISYKGSNEIIRKIYVLDKAEDVKEKNIDLSKLIGTKIWVRSIEPTGEIASFKEIIENNLSSLDKEAAQAKAREILNLLGAEEIERTSDSLLLEKSIIVNNLSGTLKAEDTSNYYMYFKPGDYLGRERIKIQAKTIRIPVSWIPRTQVADRTLNFNFAGELVSASETLPYEPARTIIPEDDLEKYKRLNIEPETLLPIMRENIYRLITHKDGTTHLSRTIDTIRLSCLMPDDMLGRELASVEFTMTWNETKLHPQSDIVIKKSLFGNRQLIEVWQEEGSIEKSRVIGKEKETLVYEWYNQHLNLQELKSHLINSVITGKKLSQDLMPKNYSQLKNLLLHSRIKKKNLLVNLSDLKKALDAIKRPPFGVLPGYHILKPGGDPGEIKYFAGLVKYPRTEFEHKGIDITYEEKIEPFSLPPGPDIKGFKYGILNNPESIWDVHTLNGQLILRQRPYIQVRLINMYPIASASSQTEYYNPMVPYSYQSPIMIKRYFKPGKQPSGMSPGLLVIGYFKNQATTYLPNGWQIQELIERRPLDIDHWILSELYYNSSGELEYKKQHIESKPLYIAKAMGFKRPFFALFIIFIAYVAGCKIFDKKLRHKKHETSTGLLLKTDNHLLKNEIKQLEEILPNEKHGLLSKLSHQYDKVTLNSKNPRELYSLCQQIYKPLLISELSSFGCTTEDYTAAINVILNRIFSSVGKKMVNLENLFPEELKQFESWSIKNGSKLSFKNGRLYQADSPAKLNSSTNKITFLVLFRVIFDNSKDFKATVPQLRYFIFDKCINFLVSDDKKSILDEISSDVTAITKALEAGYKHKPELSKEEILTYEDIADLFDGKKNGFLNKFLSLAHTSWQKKLEFLASINNRLAKPITTDYHSYKWLKTYDDKQGLATFIKNLRPLWIPLIPLFFAVLLSGILMGLKISIIPFNLNVLHAILGLILPPLKTVSSLHIKILFQNILILSTGIFTSYILIKGYLGNKNMQINKKTSIKSFWLLYVTSVFIWGVFNIFIISWTTAVINKASYADIGWMVFINGSAALLSLVFVVASFYSLFYALISFLGFIEGKIEGVGQIRSLKQIKTNYPKAKARFKDIMSFSKELQKIDYDSLWCSYFNLMINDLYNDYKISSQEKDALSLNENYKINEMQLPKNEEAQKRIQKYLGSWLMDLPPALHWHQIPALSVMITAFSESVAFSFEDINRADWGARETKLNHLISRYRDEWLEFVGRLEDDEFKRWISRKELENLSGLKRLPEGLSSRVAEKIRYWANMHVQPIEKTLRESCKIRNAFEKYARFCYGKATDEEISDIVDKKLQIILNYEGFHKDFTSCYDKTFIFRLLKEYPFVCGYWNKTDKNYRLEIDNMCMIYEKGSDAGLHKYNPQTNQIELVEKSPTVDPIKKGKPSGFNQALSFVKGETILFFDANASVRIEDALKIPLALGEFYKDENLAEILFSEYIYTSKYSWIAEAIRFNEETFTSVTQRTLNLFDACGFYGHSAIIKTNVITACGGIPQDYISEDILLSVNFWLKGYKSTHKEYLMFGKGRETSFYSALVPFSKWSIGSSNLALGRVQTEILNSKVMHYAQKIMLMFGFSFFYHIPLVLFINLLYLWLVVCWGVNAFMTVPFPFLFAVFGLLFNQSITTMGVVYLSENNKPLKALIEYLKLVGKNYLLYTAAIPSYALGFIKGLKGKLKIAISSKGWNLQHVSLKDIWGEHRAILNSITVITIIGIPILFALIELKLVPFILSPFIAFIPLIMSICFFSIGVIGARFKLPSFSKLQDELIPHGDLSEASAVKLQIIYAIGLTAFLLIGFIMWGIMFSSFASKMLFMLSILYISPPLSYMLVPVLANSQPFALFKEWTSSNIWNYIFIPLIILSCLAGSLIILTHAYSIKPESFVYLGFGVIFIIQWFLLKWKLSGYEYLKKWSNKNLKHLKGCNTALHSKIEDNIYFAHQQLLELNKNIKLSNAIHRLILGTFLIAIIIFIFYVLNELDIGIYSPWLWSLPVAGLLMAEVASILTTSEERKLLRGFLARTSLHDLEKLRNNEEYIDTIWQNQLLFYRNTLIRAYGDDERAKKFLNDFIHTYLF